MAKKARITHITTGAERAADGVGLTFDEDTHDRATRAAAQSRQVSADMLRDLADKRAKDRAEANARDTSSDRTYGPGQADGMGPKKRWQRG